MVLALGTWFYKHNCKHRFPLVWISLTRVGCRFDCFVHIPLSGGVNMIWVWGMEQLARIINRLIPQIKTVKLKYVIFPLLFVN